MASQVSKPTSHTQGNDKRTATDYTAIANGRDGAGGIPKVVTAIPGPKSKEIFANEQCYIAPGRQRISLLAGVAFDHGDGATLTDAHGNVYVDFFAGVAVSS